MAMNVESDLDPCRAKRDGGAGSRWRGLCVALSLVAVNLVFGQPALSAAASAVPGLFYTNFHSADPLWSIHVVRIDRTIPGVEIHSVHAGNHVLGMATLTAQIERFDRARGTPVAAVNGDFYQRDRDYAGDPRGLQIVEGGLLHSPSGGASVWIDAAGQPQTGTVASRFQILWPDGKATAFGLNGPRAAGGVELYTAALGASTRTAGGRELILELPEGGAWPPLRIGVTNTVRVRAVRAAGDTPLTPDTVVLSVGPGAISAVPPVAAGAVLRISTATTPDLRGAQTAISGGPVLMHRGWRQRITQPAGESYEFSSMLERHPRTAIGWNREYYFLVEVDGRQKNLSVGMTLNELSKFLAKLGCEEAMNLDGGGSATLWCEGAVRNHPCDGGERGIANALIVTCQQPATAATSGAGVGLNN